MEIEKAKKAIEAILFSAGRAVTEGELVIVLELDKEQIEKIIRNMQDEYITRGIEIIKVENSYQMCSKKEYYEYIYPILDKRAKPNLSTAALETLAIIAYNPRATRAEIEAIRGVNSDGTIYKLLEYGLIEDAGKATKKTNDEGIDGVIKEDKLGLDNIYLQAKRWQKNNVVGRPEIQKFVGALAGQGARKGIFITTSNFSKEALEYKPRNDTSIILIDGKKLVELMYEYNVGVTIEKEFKIKRLDNDFFDTF